MNRRNFIQRASMAALAALTGCKLRVESPLDMMYPYTMNVSWYTGPSRLDAVYINGVEMLKGDTIYLGSLEDI